MARWFAMASWEEVEVVDKGEVGVGVLSEYHAVGDGVLYSVTHLECFDARWEYLVEGDDPVGVDVDEMDPSVGVICCGRTIVVLYFDVLVDVVLRDRNCAWA